MFPTIKSKGSPSKNNVKEKRRWDDRFHMNEIPEYSPLLDKHTKSYRKVLTSNKQIIMSDQESPNSPLRKRKRFNFLQKTNNLLKGLIQLYQNHREDILTFEQKLTESGAPPFYIYYSLLPLITVKDITKYMLKQIVDIQKENTYYHRIDLLKKSRENCLQQFKEFLNQFQEREVSAHQNYIFTQINNLRLLTSNLIDQIKRWRESLGYIDQKAIYYTIEQQNLLLQILNDNNFIFNSKLSTFINFGKRNDPFIIAPLKKAQGKQQSSFLSLIEPEKNLSFYQRYMQYLASQKAYSMKVNMEQNLPKNDKKNVQKIYMNRQKSAPTLEGLQLAQYRELDRKKQREDRLKRNQQKIDEIKNVYERFGKKKKIPEERKKETHGESPLEIRKKQKRREIDDKRGQNQFQKLVKQKLDTEQVGSSRIQKSLSFSRNMKSEEKILQNVKEIEASLKNKLRFINSEEQNFLENNSPVSKKKNEKLIEALKQEIIQKFDKQSQEKELVKKKKRSQQQNQLEELRKKMKREIEEKMEKKKKQKLFEREQLERKLREEQQKLSKQRQIEYTLQQKIQRQKSIRQIQKVKREALQKEQKLRIELEREQKIRKEKQMLIQKKNSQNQLLINEMKKTQIKAEIQEAVRQDLNKSAKNIEDLTLSQKIESQKQKEEKIAQQLQILKMKESIQLQQLKKENQLRERMIKLQKDQSLLKKRQIENLMGAAIQKEREDLEKNVFEKTIELQSQIRANVQQKMKNEEQKSRKIQLEIMKEKRNKQLQEEAYREKVRQRIERQLRLQAINRTKKQLQLKQQKELSKKAEIEKAKLSINRNLKINKGAVNEQEKANTVQKLIFDREAKVEMAKNSLRSQFEKELLSSSIPHLYEDKDAFLLKQTNQYLYDDHLKAKQKQGEQYVPQKEQLYNLNKKKQSKDSQHILTYQQKKIFQKKKSKIDGIKQEKKVQKEEQYKEPGFQLMEKQNIHEFNSENEYDIKVVKEKEKEKTQIFKPKQKKNVSKGKKKKKKSESEDSEDLFQKKKKLKKNKKKLVKGETSFEIDSQDDEKQRVNYKKNAIKKKKFIYEDDNFVESEQKQYYEKKKQARYISQREPMRVKVRENDSQDEIPQIQRHNTVKQQNLINMKQIDPVIIRQNKSQNEASNQFKFKIELQALHEDQLDEYLGGHFSRLPTAQLDIMIYDREQLYRKLVSQLAFSLLIGSHVGKQMGMVLAYHDRSRSDVRKFIIVHASTYKSEDLQQFYLAASSYIFQKDPCDEIEFAYRYNEGEEKQLHFSQIFNKWFDKLGSIYQKKIDENIFQRKYVFKRKFNQKCEVVLGGVNKNVFRNMFSVYSGVLMSDTNMIQFKEELRDLLHPQEDVSYSILLAELFRTFLTPDEAEVLKQKVKEFVKLKELLVVVVNLQKKKIKMEELKSYEFKSLIQLNMKLMSQGKDVIRYCKQPGVDLNRVFFCEFSQGFNLPFNFQTTSLPLDAKGEQTKHVSYFRLCPLPPYKLQIIKSSLYSSEMNVLPTQNSKYKMFVMNGQQYQEMKETNKMDLFIYIRLFLKNVRAHNVAQWKYVWLPEMVDKGAWAIREFRAFFNKDLYTHDYVNFSYRQFLPGALMIQPEHRDLVITPPFIIGILSMTLEQVTQGSPLYARFIDVEALKAIEVEKV